jgi:hypothetical protein
MGLILLLGLYPAPLLSRMEPSVSELLGRVHAAEHLSPQQLARLPLPLSRLAPVNPLGTK